MKKLLYKNEIIKHKNEVKNTFGEKYWVKDGRKVLVLHNVKDIMNLPTGVKPKKYYPEVLAETIHPVFVK